ncbi:hypothetical protein Agub_g4611 [Astrephomene gubernaculifera]|uniref:Uncharacterized protein n=1 Tax=Astrephomene gubernaculifera TaxID=47775 RepID=A0AAD3DKG3_9CHLO|nr:hypothetical protein Agub_g4582 [Astrephomene gubernaculifera]GFR43507.1 hypothetical protein Agub_g4599 [Astrephomene gubernaculifera]GFR43517.1 hypothetical protein Agub_g4611 [Astrephomene gubernaculifera]
MAAVGAATAPSAAQGELVREQHHADSGSSISNNGSAWSKGLDHNSVVIILTMTIVGGTLLLLVCAALLLWRHRRRSFSVDSDALSEAQARHGVVVIGLSEPTGKSHAAFKATGSGLSSHAPGPWHGNLSASSCSLKAVDSSGSGPEGFSLHVNCLAEAQRASAVATVTITTTGGAAAVGRYGRDTAVAIGARDLG